MIRAPSFWWHRPPTWAALELWPVGFAYGAATGRRMRQPGTRLDVPVVCIGNLVAGGAGKTPTAMAVAALLRQDGFAPAFVSRGYGRRAAGPPVRRVDPARDRVEDVGDEPLLLARHASTYVGADRVLAARRAARDGATLVVLDDGLQNPRLAKQFTVAVIDGARGIGNGFCIPAGPLRAPLSAQWPHVSAVCLVGEGRHGAHAAALAHKAGKPVWRAELRPDDDAAARLRGRRLYGFAGIGHPPKFFDSLTALGLDLVGTRAFPDHYSYGRADVSALRREAQRLGADLVTTEKDRVRLPDGFPVETLPISLAFDDEAAVRTALRDALRPVRPEP